VIHTQSKNGVRGDDRHSPDTAGRNPSRLLARPNRYLQVQIARLCYTIRNSQKGLLTLNSDLYDNPALYDALLPVGAHLPYYVELARQASGDVLELACGTGQLTVPIASAGLPIVGLDLSAPMLNAAKEHAATA
jgi:2-polyprenyl-3-methyl-5-hydroxy-6-metoxy-1,4-benzoquinol methylase